MGQRAEAPPAHAPSLLLGRLRPLPRVSRSHGEVGATVAQAHADFTGSAPRHETGCGGCGRTPERGPTGAASGTAGACERCRALPWWECGGRRRVTAEHGARRPAGRCPDCFWRGSSCSNEPGETCGLAHWMRFSLKPSVGLLYQSSPWVAGRRPRGRELAKAPPRQSAVASVSPQGRRVTGRDPLNRSRSSVPAAPLGQLRGHILPHRSGFTAPTTPAATSPFTETSPCSQTTSAPG